MGHCRGDGFLGPTRSTPSLLLVFFGKCRGLRFFPRFPLLLVLNFTGVISSQEIIHLFGMFFTQGRLVCNVKHWHRALLSVCKLGSAAGEELLRAVQEDVLETMSGEGKGLLCALFTLHCSTACCWLHLLQLGLAKAGSAACSSPQFLYQLTSAFGLLTGSLQQRLPKCMPAFLLSRLCPLQAAEVLVFLLKVSAKLGHPGAPALHVVVV